MIRLKDLREDKDLYQRDIAKVWNVSQQQYSRCETGENELSYDGLIKLANFYNTSIDYILGLTNNKIPYKRTNENEILCYSINWKYYLYKRLG